MPWAQVTSNTMKMNDARNPIYDPPQTFLKHLLAYLSLVYYCSGNLIVIDRAI